MGAHHINSQYFRPNPQKAVDRLVEYEIGSRWHELDQELISEKTGLEVYLLKLMRNVGVRAYFVDGTQEVRSTRKEEVPGIRRRVEVRPESSSRVLRDGRRFITNVSITRTGTDLTFIGQITFHPNGRVALTGYNGMSI